MNAAKALHHFSPLRYPGGKAKLAPFFKTLLRDNGLLDCTYAEPFAGGAGVALTLLMHGYVNDVVLNDLSEPIYAFWVSVLNDPDRFERDILETSLSVREWERQREIFRAGIDAGRHELGFAAFYLNRTNHSGVLNGGMIGGYSQLSAHKLDARFNRRELAARVRRIAKQRDRIRVTNLDALQFLEDYGQHLAPASSILYIDPPYFAKGRDLYYDYYKPEDHQVLRNQIVSLPKDAHWVVSYDNVEQIRSLYDGLPSLTYNLSYSVRNGRSGNEVIFLSNNLTAPVGRLAPPRPSESTGDHKVPEVAPVNPEQGNCPTETVDMIEPIHLEQGSPAHQLNGATFSG